MTQELTNREMHELAAKAAGVDGVWVETHGTEVGQDACGIGRAGALFGDKLWRPREDDGDALRLAVACRITLTMHGNGVDATDLYLINAYKPYGGDPYAATREAIFQAAVAIGKAMP